MADKGHEEKKKEEGAHAPSSNKPEGEKKSGGHTFLQKAMDEGAAEAAELSAKAVYNSLSPEVQARLKDHAGWLRLARILRFIPGLPHPVEEYIQGFVSTFHHHVAEGHHEDAETRRKLDETESQLATTIKVLVAVQALGPDERQDFEEWYLADAERQASFNKLVGTAEPAVILQLASRSTSALDRMVERTKERRPLTFADLRSQIDKDEDLLERVYEFIMRINARGDGDDRVREFWTAVERRRIASFEEFKSLMDRPDEEILTYLNMPSRPLMRRIQEIIGEAELAEIDDWLEDDEQRQLRIIEDQERRLANPAPRLTLGSTLRTWWRNRRARA